MATPCSGSRAGAYAEQLEDVSASLLALLEGCSLREWRSSGPEGDSCVGDLAHQLALDLADARELLTALVAGVFLPSRMEVRGMGSLRASARREGGDRGEIIALLQVNVAALGELIASLSEDQLTGSGHPNQTGDRRGTSVPLIIETLVLGSLRDALSRIQAAIQTAPRTPGGVGKI